MKCMANIICCGSALLAVGIACTASLCSNRRVDDVRRVRKGWLKEAALAIARATGYNYIKLRVYSDPNFRSCDWDTTDDDTDSTDDEFNPALVHDGRPSTSSAEIERGRISIAKKGKFVSAGDSRDDMYSRTW